jgi:hypothetical protein
MHPELYAGLLLFLRLFTNSTCAEIMRKSGVPTTSANNIVLQAQLRAGNPCFHDMHYTLDKNNYLGRDSLVPKTSEAEAKIRGGNI